MRPTDLFGKSVAEYKRAVAQLKFAPSWDVRLKDQDGKVWPIPPQAILGRTRSSAVDSGTWECSIELDRAKLPKGVMPEQYHTLEIDRLMAGVWPYFRGQIDKVSEGIRYEEGAAVSTLTLQANGVLQRIKNYRIDVLSIEPTATKTIRQLTGIVTTQRVSSNVVIPEPQWATSAFNPTTLTFDVTSSADYTVNMKVYVSSPAGGDYVQVTAVPSGTKLTCTAPAHSHLAGFSVYPVEPLPLAGNVFATSVDRGYRDLVVSPNADLSTAYTGADYQITGDTGEPLLLWYVKPAATRYFQYGKVERFVSPRNQGTARPSYFQLPYGRDLNDLYPTTVTSISGNTIGLADPTPLKTDGRVWSTKVTAGGSGYASEVPITFSAPPAGGRTAQGAAIASTGVIQRIIILDPGSGYLNPPSVTIGGLGSGAQASAFLGCMLDPGQGEYLTFIPSTGTSAGQERMDYKIQSIDHANGRVTLNSPPPTGLQVGDPVWIGTVDYHQAWYDLDLITYYKDAGKTQKWDQRTFQTYANIGQGVAVKGGIWVDTPVFAEIAEIYDVDVNGAHPNRIEEAIKALLSGTTGLFQSSDIVTGQTGLLMKNFRTEATTLEDVIRTLKEGSMGPADFIRDTSDGKVYIGPFRQKSMPDWELRGVTSIAEADRPEPITAVTIIAESEPVNQTAALYAGASNLDRPDYLYDGKSDKISKPNDPAQPSTVSFRFPKVTPLQAYPYVKSIKVTGVGMMSVYLKGATRDYYLPGWNYKVIGSFENEDTTKPKPETVEIPQEDLVKLFDREAIETNAVTIALSFEAEMPCQLGEIEVFTVNHNAWRAELTDDITKAIADKGPDQLGTYWTQPDTTQKVSYRYAPSAYLKRAQSQYTSPSNQRPRHEVRRLKGINAQDCRDYAENYISEYQRAAKTYTVEAPLIDFGELGDTVRLWWPDGRMKDLFYWEENDTGGPLDDVATYTLRDYSS